MAKHLSSRDARFLAGVSLDTVRKLDAIIALADDVVREAEARGVEPDLTPLDAVDEDEVLADPDALDTIRGDLRHQLGAIGRGEYDETDNGTSD
jgi:hypothetical protein